MAAEIQFGKLLIAAAFLVEVQFIIIGLSAVQALSGCNDHSECGPGKYCDPSFGCFECQLCVGHGLNTQVDWCRTNGVKCPKFCVWIENINGNEPDNEMCSVELLCGSYEVPTIKDRSFARVNVSTMVPQLKPNGQVATITQEGDIYSDGDDFPIGLTSIPFVARYGGENEVRCMVNITVYDDQAPNLIYCPNDTLVRFITENQPIYLNLTKKPSCVDNSNKSCHVELVEPSDLGSVSFGITTVVYKGTDEWNNTNYCNVSVQVVKLQCPDIQNDTWTNPTIIGGEENFDYQCNQSEGSILTGNSSVHCVLQHKIHADKRHDYFCPVEIHGPTNDESYQPNKPRLSTKLIVIVSSLSIVVVACILTIFARYIYGRHKKGQKRIDENGAHPQLYNDPTGHMNMNENPITRNGGYTELSEREISTPAGTQCVVMLTSWKDIVEYSATARAGATGEADATHEANSEHAPTVTDLLNKVEVIQKLHILLHPIEEFLKFVGYAYGIKSEECDYLLQIARDNPNRHPACAMILDKIKSTTSNENGIQSICTLLYVMQYYYDQGIGNKDQRIKKAIDLIRSSCQQHQVNGVNHEQIPAAV